MLAVYGRPGPDLHCFGLINNGFAGLDLVGWFQQQVCTEWAVGNVAPPAGVDSPVSTDVVQTMQMPGSYVVGVAAAALPTSSGSVGEEQEEGHQSNDSSASPSGQNNNNSVGLERPTRQCQYSSRQRAARITYSEIDDKIERVKQKRRESAQRSRARKNAYMKELEVENAGLRAQVAQLQQVVSQLQSMQYMNMGAVPANTVPSC